MNFFHYALLALGLVVLRASACAIASARAGSRAGPSIGVGALLVLSPFVWLVPAVFKTGDAFNDYVFFPPLSKWSGDDVARELPQAGRGAARACAGRSTSGSTSSIRP